MHQPSGGCLDLHPDCHQSHNNLFLQRAENLEGGDDDHHHHHLDKHDYHVHHDCHHSHNNLFLQRAEKLEEARQPKRIRNKQTVEQVMMMMMIMMMGMIVKEAGQNQTN